MISHCGYIALIGRPNVGKSTLLNCIIEQKLSITSSKPQTTRHRILGIKTISEDQYIYVDTPGIHKTAKKTMNRLMNKTANTVLFDVDVIVFIVEAGCFGDEDEYVLNRIKQTNIDCILVLNKVDKIVDKAELLPFIQKISLLHSFAAIIPISAKTGLQVDSLEKEIKRHLPEGPHLFPDGEITDRPLLFFCAELLREKIFRLTGQELPYVTTVTIESFKVEAKLIRIHALIFVDTEKHKRMIIGKYGSKLKDMATAARLDMETLLSKKVFLHCFCKVKTNWADDGNLLKQLGHDG